MWQCSLPIAPPLPLDDAFRLPTGGPKGWLLTCRGREAASARTAHWLLQMGRVWREPRAPPQGWPREWSQVRAGCARLASSAASRSAWIPSTLSLPGHGVCAQLPGRCQRLGVLEDRAQSASCLPLRTRRPAMLPGLSAASLGSSLPPIRSEPAGLRSRSRCECRLLARQACSVQSTRYFVISFFMYVLPISL